MARAGLSCYLSHPDANLMPDLKSNAARNYRVELSPSLPLIYMRKCDLWTTTGLPQESAGGPLKAGLEQLTIPAWRPNKGLTFQGMSALPTLTNIHIYLAITMQTTKGPV